MKLLLFILYEVEYIYNKNNIFKFSYVVKIIINLLECINEGFLKNKF